MREVKQRKMITLDHDVWYKLQGEDNASDLINRLLVQHYKDKAMNRKQLSETELEELKKKHALYRELEKELKEKLG
jgi:predicted CopG family antitoxin